MKSETEGQRNIKLAKYLGVARAVAELSKDPSTKVGAVVIGPDGEGSVWGYNGAPRGSKLDEREVTREVRLMGFEHAERNAIFAAARAGVPTKGCSIVVTAAPCHECARAIIQAGITTVVAPKPDKAFSERWKESMAMAATLFEECGVNQIFVEEV